MLSLALAVTLAQPSGADAGWKVLGPGVEYAAIQLVAKPSRGDGRLHVVRIDPAVADLTLALASARDGGTATAGTWCRREGLLVAINAGMYETDHRSNVGRLVDDAHVNQGRWNAYQSVLLFEPKSPELPAARLADRDAPGFKDLVGQYRAQVQNLRLIKGQAQSVWKANGRAWSEAAVAEDDRGRVLFLFLRTPLEMAEFIRRVVALPLGIQRAMHVEGGPEASLSICTDELQLDLMGSYETGFFLSDGNQRQWPIPNVLGVRRAAPHQRRRLRRRHARLQVPRLS